MEGLLTLLNWTGTAWAHGDEEHVAGGAGGVVQSMPAQPAGGDVSSLTGQAGNFFSNLWAQVGTADALLFFLFILAAVILYERQAKLLEVLREVHAELKALRAGENLSSGSSTAEDAQPATATGPQSTPQEAPSP